MASETALGITALLSWAAAAGVGLFLFAVWIQHVPVRRRATASGPTRAYIWLHTGGLIGWAAYLLTGVGLLAWLGLAALIGSVVAGELIFLRWLGGGDRVRLPTAAVYCHGMLLVMTVPLVAIVTIGI